MFNKPDFLLKNAQPGMIDAMKKNQKAAERPEQDQSKTRH